MKLTALVDFDGVILKSPGPSNYIKRKVEQYVKAKTSVQNAPALNEDLYKRHGHTFLGLKKLGVVSSYRDFNNFVYGQKQEYAHYKLTQEELADWHQFRQDMDKIGVTVKLFSNSDKRWLTQFIEYDKDLYSLQDALENYEDNMYSQLIKPKREIHDFVHYQIPKSSFVFIDDKLSNFEISMEDPRWLNIWLQKFENGPKLFRNLYATTTLENSTKLINEKTKNLKSINSYAC
jgi:hypothetical protein